MIERFEDEPIMCCDTCGLPLDWEACDQCDGEGVLYWETLRELDPLWYQPYDTERCEQCSGKGGWWVCPACRVQASGDKEIRV